MIDFWAAFNNWLICLPAVAAFAIICAIYMPDDWLN